jgi:hypothetical protein
VSESLTASIARKAVSDARAALDERIALHTAQFEAAQADVASRQVELAQAQDDLASMDAWLVDFAPLDASWLAEKAVAVESVQVSKLI